MAGSRGALFADIEAALPAVAAEVGVALEGSFAEVLRGEWRKVPGLGPPPPDEAIRDDELHRLYDDRARLLPWDLSPGYLASFARNRGSAYTARRVYEVLDSLLPADLAGRRVLEVGSGAGILVNELARRGADAVGLEVAEIGSRFGRVLARNLGRSRARFTVGDGEALPFVDRSFDLVVSTEVLEHFLRPDRALSEIRRVLRPEGVVVITTPCAWSPSELFMSAARWLKRDLQVEAETHFDKKLYFALERQGSKPDPALLWRVHRRFAYGSLVRSFERAGFRLERSLGAVLDVPPHFHLAYRYLLGPVLPLVRALEDLLNLSRILPRLCAISTCFRLRPQ